MLCGNGHDLLRGWTGADPVFGGPDGHERRVELFELLEYPRGHQPLENLGRCLWNDRSNRLEALDKRFRELMRTSLGTALAVSDQAMVDGMLRMGRTEGVSAAPEGGAALAAIERLVEDGQIRATDTVVLFNTGGALKYLDVLREDQRPEIRG